MTLLTLSQQSAMTLLLTATENPEAVSTYIFWLIAAVVVIILLAVFLIVFLVRNQSLKKANKRLEADIIELKEYGLQMRDTLVAWNENNLSQATKGQSDMESQSTKEDEEPSSPADDPDWHLYMKLENRLMKDSLFLNPKLSRDDLAAMMGIQRSIQLHRLSEQETHRPCDEADGSPSELYHRCHRQVVRHDQHRYLYQLFQALLQHDTL